MAIRLEAPSLDRQTLAPAEAVAVALLLGLLLADALRMTPLYLRYMAPTIPLVGGNYDAAMALGIGGVVGLLLLGQAAVARLLDRRGGFWTPFARLSLIWLPLALAAHLALSAQHLVAAGSVVRNLAAELALVAPGHMPPADAYSFLWPMKGLQWAMLAAGVLVSLYLARRSAARQGRASLAAAVALPALPLLIIFGQPMSNAC